LNIDFHYGVIYIVSRLAGLSVEDAQIVGYACQYVDDSTTNDLLKFADGEIYERVASAHQAYDYKNAIDIDNREVWVPFHFLPGAEGDTFAEKVVCRADSAVARTMVRSAIQNLNPDHGLHSLGVTLHAYVDTWAHQLFSGVISRYNIVTDLKGDDLNEENLTAPLKRFFTAALENIQTQILGNTPLLGHGAALHYPDMPWANWSYMNGFNQLIQRENLTQFVQAADMACRVVQAYVHNNDEFEKEIGLAPDAKQALHDLLASNQSHDPMLRLASLSKSLAAGLIPTLKEEIPAYIPKGMGSWHFTATGLMDSDAENNNNLPVWSIDFENSHYRKFHDAVKAHIFVVVQEILPSHGLRVS
jgi:hypothetical protein